MQQWDFCLRDEMIDGIKPSDEGWLWPKSDDGLWDGPKENWTQFKPLIQKHCSAFKVAVQAGGACGMYPRLLSEMFETVYTFEPSALSFHCLVHNCARERIVKFNTALGESHQMANVNYGNPANVGTNTVTSSADGFVPVLMVDDLELKHCDLIMLDVEGYEINALIGARDTILRHRPLITCENGSSHDINMFMDDVQYEMIGVYHADTYWKPKA